MTVPARLISLERLRGLEPSTWIVAGPGFAREEIKSLLLRSGGAFVADAVTTTQDLARKIVSASSGRAIPAESVVNGLARQEALRLLLAEPRISARLMELKKLRRQGGFFRRLDLALQAGRLAVAHAEEEEVIFERLELRFGRNPVREELVLLSRAYEAWLEGSGLWDPPMILRAATRALVEQGWPEGLAAAEEILHFTVQQPESLERAFWEAVGARIPVRRPELAAAPSERTPQWAWERWHTLDDACEKLAQELKKALSAGESPSSHAVLIADSAAVRRSLKRALRDWGIPETDPRDPTRLQWEETVKWAMLPLELVGRNFERGKLVAWIRSFLADEEARRDGLSWIAELSARGARMGLRSCQGGTLALLHARLEKLQAELGGKKTCEELSRAHLALLRSNLAERARIAPEAAQEMAWAMGFFEEVWAQFSGDLQLLGLKNRRAPALLWLERLQARVREAPAPVERARPAAGIAVYRLQQAPLEGARKLWVLGLSSNWLSADGGGDYWFSEREREVLSAEFAVRSGIQARSERLSVLRAWLGDAESITVLDALHDADGRERELIFPILKEWAGSAAIPEAPLEMGSHPRWTASYGALRPLQAQEVKLSPLPLRPGATGPEMTATALDRYSRCAFQSLALDRWRLREAREPDCELWADARGNILHEAVRLLMESRTEAGNFGCTPREALEQAWKLKPPKGLIRSPSVERYLRSRMVQVLESFCEKEREYFDRARATVRSLENAALRARFGEVTVVGTPDRVDETSDGLFIMDYKTSSGLPNGSEMAELGYRLQLPFYALATEQAMGKPVLGVQFVELTRKATRSSGIFFKRHNGKDPGKLTHVRSNSKSLLPGEPGEAWPRFREQITAHAEAYARGEFLARPKRADKECQSCQAADLCGYRRKISDGLLEEAEASGSGGGE